MAVRAGASLSPDIGARVWTHGLPEAMPKRAYIIPRNWINFVNL
jgi:hypothetical protein